MSEKIDNNVPTTMNITIASANDAIAYWLSNAILQSDVKIKEISFTEKDHFKITFDREIEKSI